MKEVRTNRILPAFLENEMDWDKVKNYAFEMKKQDEEYGAIQFPPICGYFDVVNKEDIGMFFNWGALNEGYEEKVTKSHIGIEIFRVTDGNHRVWASHVAKIWSLETEDDKSGFVSIII